MANGSPNIIKLKMDSLKVQREKAGLWTIFKSFRLGPTGEETTALEKYAVRRKGNREILGRKLNNQKVEQFACFTAGKLNYICWDF